MTTPPASDVAFDCRFFLGDRPCTWHKREGVVCTCARYEPIHERVLIIKLDAMGDVLRTTALLPMLREAHPRARVTWLTRQESVPLLAENPVIDEVVPYGPDAVTHLGVREFDRVINLDAGRLSAGLASLARSSHKDGFVLAPAGHVTPTNPAARRWLEMGIDDSLKRRGTRTYQSWMSDILGIGESSTGYVYVLRQDELAQGRAHLTDLGLDLDRPIVGLNTGAGGRWPLKQWRAEGFVQLVAQLADWGVQPLLLGGPGEEERNQQIQRDSATQVFDGGTRNPVRHFSALVACCDVVVTGDTLAMHLALALRRRTVVLFGPTSAPEIEMYDLGEKVIPDMTCLSCYKTACDFVPNCMDLIETDTVARAVHRQLLRAGARLEPRAMSEAR